ncbi:MAG: Tetratricopeptide repeat protein [Fibrobacteres bacterium]|nr:Tetratricopeptide repeat protein [Fibrobacterota bacterium]
MPVWPLSFSVRARNVFPCVLAASLSLSVFDARGAAVAKATWDDKAGSALGSGNADQGNKAAWKLFLDNKPLEARDAFRMKCSDKDPVVAGEACRGAGVVSRFIGQNVDEIKWTLDGFARDKDTLALMAGQLRHLNHSDIWAAYSVPKVFELGQELARHPSQLTSPAVFELSHRYLQDGEISKAEKITADMSIIRKWWTVGPFSNISGSGFDMAYPPESGVALGQAHDGKNGDKVRWFPLNVPSPATWIWSNNHGTALNAVNYYATQVESPSERKVQLAFGASGSFKVFLNDRLVLAERAFRNTGADAFVQPVTLRKGSNRILVKLGSEDRYANFLLRFMEADGRGAADLKVAKPEGAYPKEPGTAENLKSMPAFDREIGYLRERLRKNPDDEDAALLVMDLFNVHEMTDSGEVWALRRLERHPQSSLWLSLMAETLMRSRQSTRSQEYYKAAYRNSPYCASGWNQELARLINSAGPEAVLEFLSKSPDEMKSTKRALLTTMGKLAQLGRRDEAFKVFATLENANQDFDDETANFLSIVYMNQGRKKEAIDAWRKYLKHGHANVGAYSALSDLYLKSGDFSQAVDVLREGTGYLPDNPNLLMTLANINMHQKRYDEAEKYLASALALAPFNPGLLGLKGTLRSLAGDKDGAKKTLKQSVESNYNDFPSWDKLMTMDGKPTFESLAPLPSVDSLVRASAGWEGLKRDRGSILSYIEDVYFYPSRAVRHRGFLVVHLPSQDAVNNWKQYSIPYNSTYQSLGVTRAFSRKAAGSEVDAEVVGGRTLIFKSLEPGDCIVMEWTIKDDYDGEMARQAWGVYDFKLGMPVFDSRLRLYMAADTIGYSVRGKGIVKSASEKAGVKMRLFTRGPYAPPINERFLPINEETAPDVLYSTFSDWGRITEWYANLTDHKTEPSPILRKIADSLFAGAATETEKVARVHRYVTDNIAYSSLSFRQSGWIPQSSQEVIASRLGDCKDMAALAKTLLQLGGMQSRLVLVATRDEYGTRPGPVGPHFNHCILGLTVDGAQHFVDLTDPHLNWNRIPKADQGSMALVISRGNRDLIRLPVDAPAERRVSRTFKCALTDSGSADIDARTVRTGVLARGHRDGFRFLNQEERRQEMLKVLSDDYADVALDSLSFGDLGTGTDSVEYAYHFRGRQAVKVSGPTRIFSLYMPDRLSNMDIPDDQPRPAGADLYASWYSVGTYATRGTVSFPPKWKLLNRPEPVRLKSPYGDYNLTFTLKGNVLSYTRSAVLNLGEPVAGKDVPKLRDFLTQVVRNDDVQLVFTEKGK